ncbi:conserved hypothetical protein [Talaromyces stipitatus ATCC 10500]|uniref:Uncharacterized protein n=1 Tax=Talaromyces stipitatus (strain ATCC 10500 / CBS 375.48 / QM 6759 / NRRL 1006) TaxID=441959 RepID=B8MQW4_TALSN|nr:uncharacterized protein TSTA_053170 [Talaromyces stipitatus ATCC 10500]EED12799.1 conserved hypothetical protein [Talaromyces stipitatus ATCC 10500]
MLSTANTIDEYHSSSMDLPTLTETALRHPDCCCSLSSTLLDAITSNLCENIDSGLVLSVGSGTGLLEALLLSLWTSSFVSVGRKLNMEGVEVLGSESLDLHSPNRYLPEECFNVVKGSWALSSRVKQAAAIMFVYPRSTELVRRYMEEAALFSDKLHIALWLGPSSDWAEFEPSFTVSKLGELMKERVGYENKISFAIFLIRKLSWKHTREWDD